MRVVIASGHGKIALLLERLLAERGDQAVGLGRNPAHVADVRKAGAEAVVCDLEAASAGDLVVLIAPGDKGYTGEEPIRTPYRGRNKPASQQEANRAHARLRAPGERANAQLKSWRILRKLRCCPGRAGQLAKAIHVLQVRAA